MAEKYTPYNMPIDENRFLCAFNHIFGGGYAAGYNSYKVRLYSCGICVVRHWYFID